MEQRSPDVIEKLTRFFYLVLFDSYFRTIGAAFFVCFFWFGAVYIHIQSGYADYWQHMSAIRALASNVFNPPPLFLDAPYEVHLYTPYHLFWGAVMGLGELSPWTVMSLVSLTNLLVFAWACRLVARHVLDDSRFDFLLMVTLVFLWGTPPSWSGIYNAGQLVLQASYPSFLRWV